jgi:hypothetical protein
MNQQMTPDEEYEFYARAENRSPGGTTTSHAPIASHSR